VIGLGVFYTIMSYAFVTGRRHDRVGDHETPPPPHLRRLGAEDVPPMYPPDALYARRSGFTEHQLWVTAYDPTQRFAAGDYPSQQQVSTGLPTFGTGDRPLEDTDVVVWYTLGAHHIVRPEDWPVMPVTTVGFMLRPSGFFDGNPALDVPPEQACHNDGLPAVDEAQNGDRPPG